MTSGSGSPPSNTDRERDQPLRIVRAFATELWWPRSGRSLVACGHDSRSGRQGNEDQDGEVRDVVEVRTGEPTKATNLVQAMVDSMATYFVVDKPEYLVKVTNANPGYTVLRRDVGGVAASVVDEG